jgi:acyl-CoA thioesterase-1
MKSFMKFWKGSGGVAAAAERRGNARAYGFQAWIVNALATSLLILAAAGPAPAQDSRPRLLVLGDSLTAGFGLPSESAFPARLQDWLKRSGLDVNVINAGVSGDTSAGGLARLDWALGTSPPEFALVELGANDGLRGLPPASLEANLDKILTRLKGRGVKVLLAGMYAPRNFGREYAAEFDAVFPRLAERHQVPLYPFFLDGAATDPALNQPDGIHPNARGVEAIVERIGPHVRRLIAGG